MITGLLNVFRYIDLAQPYSLMKMYTNRREEPSVLYEPNWLVTVDQIKLIPP